MLVDDYLACPVVIVREHDSELQMVSGLQAKAQDLQQPLRLAARTRRRLFRQPV
jgi:hypothetical protein